MESRTLMLRLGPDEFSTVVALSMITGESLGEIIRRAINDLSDRSVDDTEFLRQVDTVKHRIAVQQAICDTSWSYELGRYVDEHGKAYSREQVDAAFEIFGHLRILSPQTMDSAAIARFASNVGNPSEARIRRFIELFVAMKRLNREA